MNPSLSLSLCKPPLNLKTPTWLLVTPQPVVFSYLQPCPTGLLTIYHSNQNTEESKGHYLGTASVIRVYPECMLTLIPGLLADKPSKAEQLWVKPWVNTFSKLLKFHAAYIKDSEFNAAFKNIALKALAPAIPYILAHSLSFLTLHSSKTLLSPIPMFVSVFTCNILNSQLPPVSWNPYLISFLRFTLKATSPEKPFLLSTWQVLDSNSLA